MRYKCCIENVRFGSSEMSLYIIVELTTIILYMIYQIILDILNAGCHAYCNMH